MLNGVRVFLMRATSEALIPAYFFATAIGATLLISKVMKSLPVSAETISSSTARSCSGVFGRRRRRKSTSTVTRLS